MKYVLPLAVAAIAVTAPATAAAQSFDSNPTVGFTYGSGNNYTPANAVVLTGREFELALRAHVPTEVANSTGGTGIYNFALGSNISFDFSVFGTAIDNASVTITNLTTGQDATFAAALLGSLQSSGAIQGSQQLRFGFLNGTLIPTENIGFNANQATTYRIDLSGGGRSITAFAQQGVAAVPEPGTWAMMLVGFGAIGATMRRRRRAVATLKLA